MTNMLNQSTRLPRVTKTKFLVMLAVAAVVIAATFVHADSDRNRPESNTLAGTWLSNIEPGVPPGLLSYMTDGRVIYSRPITLLTGPGSSVLVGVAQGEWIRTGHHEFASTMFQFASGPGVEFA